MEKGERVKIGKEQGMFILRVYDAWCKDPRIPKTDNPMKYLHPFNPDEFLATLPVDTPLDVAVDKLIQHCYEHGSRKECTNVIHHRERI